jgi:glycosyltransferase involved in cell wall biosynthesis
MTRVTVVSPEPTPYRSLLFDRIAARDDVDLTVVYAGRSVADRTWTVTPEHRSVYLRGFRLPGARTVVRHDYPVTPGIVRALNASHPDVVVVSGWSTFASQAAVAWCRLKRIPYVLHVESHDLEPRPGWRRAVKRTVVPALVRGASSVLVVGTAARESVIARGAAPARVRVFANTIDVGRWIDRADKLAPAPHDGVVVVSVGRAVREKGLDVLEVAAADAGVRLDLVTGGVPEEDLARR